MPLVKAKLPGFFKGARVRKDKVFEWPEGKKLAKWVDLYKPAKAEAPVEAKAEAAPEKAGVLSKLGWGNKTREQRIEEDLAG